MNDFQRKTCAFITLGCKVNQYETQAIREAVLKKGYTEATPGKPADLYVINTCAVTTISENKSRQSIRKVIRQNPQARVIVTGCYAEADKEAIENMKGVDIVLDQDKKAYIDQIIDNNEGSVISIDSGSIFDMGISRFNGRTRPFIKIEDGCDNYCSYCIVPYVRGSVKSRPMKEIIEEAERLVLNGYKEIVLTGIHLGAYGKEIENRKQKIENKKNLTEDANTDTYTNTRNKGSCLINLLKGLEEISGLKRIRLSSIESNEITEGLISLIAGSAKICPHFHIPLQSGDDYILKLMNRKYTSRDFLSVIDLIRDRIETPSFTTDVIIGFPGEGTRHFENTVEICKRAGFSRLHIFPYSPRNGTPAARLDNRCSDNIIKERKEIMRGVARDLAFKYKQNFIRKELKVLVESHIDKDTGMLCGYTERYVKVLFEGQIELMNKIITVDAIGGRDNYIIGRMKDEKEVPKVS